jgi:hypothetical protein
MVMTRTESRRLVTRVYLFYRAYQSLDLLITVKCVTAGSKTRRTEDGLLVFN